MLKKSSFPSLVPSSYQVLTDRLSSPSVLKAAIIEKDKNSLEEDILRCISDSKVPVAIIWGAKDLTSKEDKQITPIYRFIKPVLEKRLENTGHAIIFTNLRELVEFIQNFVKIINK